MAWYLFALVDRLPAARLGRGIAGGLAARCIPGGFAIAERRADVPPVELGTLKTHEAVVAHIAAAVPAILPVRFGTLLETEDIEEALGEREEEIAEAFALVRGRVQFTWRYAETRRARDAWGARGATGAAAARGLGVETRSAKPAVLSGAEYLRRAAAKATPPVVFRTLRAKLRPLIAAERYDGATATLPDSLYHLVDRSSTERYRLLAEKLAATRSALSVTGPFPPFAFTPELL